jgi:hypothetical protein
VYASRPAVTPVRRESFNPRNDEPRRPGSEATGSEEDDPELS